jgi:hypothetical protein
MEKLTKETQENKIDIENLIQDIEEYEIYKSKILQKQKKTNLSACIFRGRLNKNIVISIGLISTVTNKILHHFINKAFFQSLGGTS